MTRRMVAAIASPHVDVLGHCTGRLLTGRGRPQSEFDVDVVLAACHEFDTALEINCRPERLDPPREMLRKAVAADVKVSISTDAHATGQLDWQPYGTDRAAECGVTAERIVNSWKVDKLLAWCERAPDAVINAVLFDWRWTVFADEDDRTWIRNSAASIGRTLSDDEIEAIIHRLRDGGTATGDRGRARRCDTSLEVNRAAMLALYRAAGLDDELAVAIWERDGHPDSSFPYADTGRCSRNCVDATAGSRSSATSTTTSASTFGATTSTATSTRTSCRSNTAARSPIRVFTSWRCRARCAAGARVDGRRSCVPRRRVRRGRHPGVDLADDHGRGRARTRPGRCARSLEDGANAPCPRRGSGP